MVAVSDIVQVTITVQNAALTRQGFNSLLILCSPAAFAIGWDDFEVRSYTSYQQVAADVDIIAGSSAQHMAQTAFAQSPHVPILYIAKGTSAGIGADLPATDLDSVILSNNLWFGLVMDAVSTAAIDSAIPWAAANKKNGWFRITDATTLPAAKSHYSSVWYSASASDSLKYLDVGIASRFLAYIPGQVVAAYKSLEGVEPTNPSATIEADLKAARVNWYPTVAGSDVTYQGWSYGANLGFIDTYVGALYLEARISEDVWSTLRAAGKVPFTNAGVNQIVSAVQNRLQTSITEGYLTNDPAPVVQAPLVAEISPTDKAGRTLPNVRFQAYTAGAIQTVMIDGIVIA